MLVDDGVGGKLRVKRRGEDAALADEHGVAGILGKDFDSRAGGLDDGRAYENHFDGFLAELRRRTEDVARELAAVAIARDGDVEQAKRRLRWMVNLACEKNRAGARAEERAAIGGKFLERIEEALFCEDLEVRAAFAAGKNYAIEVVHILRATDVGVFDAEAVEHLGVGLEITLDG